MNRQPGVKNVLGMWRVGSQIPLSQNTTPLLLHSEIECSDHCRGLLYSNPEWESKIEWKKSDNGFFKVTLTSRPTCSHALCQSETILFEEEQEFGKCMSSYITPSLGLPDTDVFSTEIIVSPLNTQFVIKSLFGTFGCWLPPSCGGPTERP